VSGSCGCRCARRCCLFIQYDPIPSSCPRSALEGLERKTPAGTRHALHSACPRTSGGRVNLSGRPHFGYSGMNPDGSASAFVTAQDGLKLHVREWGGRAATVLPVVCLPGLSRTTADFEPLAEALVGDTAARTTPRRRVIASILAGAANRSTTVTRAIILSRPSCSTCSRC
jgi:hypothetical protein